MGVTEKGRKLFVFVLVAVMRNHVHLFEQQAECIDWLIERKIPHYPNKSNVFHHVTMKTEFEYETEMMWHMV